MPDLIADAFDCLGEEMSDWLTLEPVAPLYRSFFPDGSVLDVHSDVDQMSEEIERVISAEEAAGYRRYVDFVSKLYRYEMNDFIDRNIDSPLDLLTPDLARLVALGGFRRLAPKVRAVPQGPAHGAHLLVPGHVRGRLARTTRSPSTRSSPTWTRSPGCSSPRAACTRFPRPWRLRPRSTASSSATAPRSRRSRRSATARSPSSRRTATGSPPTPSCSTPTCPSRTATCSGASPGRSRA